MSSSNISDKRYGYDFVVATTQSAINATMLNFLAGLTEPVCQVCYVADAKGQPVLMAYADLLKAAHNSDPFKIPANADPSKNQDIKNLRKARFIAAFQAQLGVPHVPDPTKLPNIITLPTTGTAVSFNMLCSEFTICALQPNAYTDPPVTWVTFSQDPSSPWVFTSNVDVQKITSDQNLPPDVQKRINNLSGTAFSVQQLLFDLSTASLQSVPTVSGLDPTSDASTLLTKYFMNVYFKQMTATSQPLLGCAVVPQNAPDPSSLTMTALEFNVNPFVDGNGQPISTPTTAQQQASTLNYLCAINNKQLPPPVPFGWNWVDPSQLSDHDGVIAINRNSLASYFQAKLAPKVPANCLVLHAWVTLDALSEPQFGGSVAGGGTPTVTTPATGQTVLQFSYDSGNVGDQAGINGDLGQVQVNSQYSLTVDFVGTTMVVTQKLVVYLWLKHLLTQGGSHIKNVSIVDTYTLGVDATGRLVTSLHSVPTDNSEGAPSTDGFQNFFTNFDGISSQFTNNITSYAGTQLHDIPVAVVQDFVFPGGKTFLFKGAAFSSNQDLVAQITYADTSGQTGTPTTTQPAAPTHPQHW